MRHSGVNALAESVMGLLEAEVIRQQGPWRALEHVEYATLDWVHWFSTQRLLEPHGYLRPAALEPQFYPVRSAQADLVALD